MKDEKSEQEQTPRPMPMHPPPLGAGWKAFPMTVDFPEPAKDEPDSGDEAPES